MICLVERLRQIAGKYDEYDWHGAIELEAADEIERLKAIEGAAQNMCDVRGRHHSELAMKRLIEVCKGKQDEV